MAQGGKISPGDWVRHGEEGDWILAREAREDGTAQPAVDAVGPGPGPSGPILTGPMTSDVPRQRIADGAPDMNPTALGGFIAGLLGLLVLPLPLGVASLGLGGWALAQVRSTGRTSGRKLALASLVIGLVDVGFWAMWTVSHLTDGLPS